MYNVYDLNGGQYSGSPQLFVTLAIPALIVGVYGLANKVSFSKLPMYIRIIAIALAFLHVLVVIGFIFIIYSIQELSGNDF
jgi:hypothetical protein